MSPQKRAVERDWQLAGRLIDQRLSTGITVRQDFRSAVRFALYSTGIAEWPYATHGGTAFVVNLDGRPYAITCAHVFRDFDWRQLIITEAKFGRLIAPLKAIFYPTKPRGAAVGSDILDLAIIEFADEVSASFFTDPPYIVDANTWGPSDDGDVLLVNGMLKKESDIDGDAITPIYCMLPFCDNGPCTSDPVLRDASGPFDNPELDSVTGISGSPVFNASKRQLCGMVVRGGVKDLTCRIRYIDMRDIHEALMAVVSGRLDAEYKKTLLVRCQV